MHDQAKNLRGLLERRASASSAANSNSSHNNRSHTVTFASSKGGVGKSNLALNLAITLAQADRSVLIVDANWGVGNLELLCGQSSRWNFSHVIAGSKHLDEIAHEGPEGISILPGAESLINLAHDAKALQEVFALLEKYQRRFDFVINDLGTGVHRFLPRFVDSADRVLIVTSAEPPAIADAYATIKTLSANSDSRWGILVNQVEQESQAETIFQKLEQTTRFFLQKQLEWAGSIPRDSHVVSAIVRRNPFVLEHPRCPASQAIQKLACMIINQHDHQDKANSSTTETIEQSVSSIPFPSRQHLAAS